eukprot:827607_1
MNAPKPMERSVGKKRHKTKKPKYDNEIELETQISKKEKNKKNTLNFNKKEIKIGEFIAVHLNSQRKYIQFNKILQIGRINRTKILNKPSLLKRIIENGISSGDQSLIDSKFIYKRATKLICDRHGLFSEISSGATDKNQKHIQKLLRKKDVINTVFGHIDGDDNNGIGGNFVYSPAELRKLEELPERAPSQRPQQEKKTNISDDLWEQSNIVYGETDIKNNNNNSNNNNNNNNNKSKCINMDDIWEVTGALPPELMEALEDPYDPWKEDELKPVQKPLRDDEEEEYRDKLTNHFKQRRELLKRKYWLPRWCRYVVWIILISLIILFVMLFLSEGNKLGATFLWIPSQFNNTNCTISISEQTRFDYDFSLDESKRRNPACSPQEIQGSMPHCWDYRVRFTIASLISFLTSIILVQPLYIAILALIAITCLPICKPACISIRNKICGFNKNDPGYKHFLGGTILISGDTNLEYGQLADEESRLSQMSVDPNDTHEESQLTQGSGRGDSKTQPLLT